MNKINLLKKHRFLSLLIISGCLIIIAIVVNNFSNFISEGIVNNFCSENIIESGNYSISTSPAHFFFVTIKYVLLFPILILFTKIITGIKFSAYMQATYIFSKKYDLKFAIAFCIPVLIFVVYKVTTSNFRNFDFISIVEILCEPIILEVFFKQLLCVCNILNEKEEKPTDILITNALISLFSLFFLKFELLHTLNNPSSFSGAILIGSVIALTPATICSYSPWPSCITNMLLLGIALFTQTSTIPIVNLLTTTENYRIVFSIAGQASLAIGTFYGFSKGYRENVIITIEDNPAEVE